MVKSGVLWSRRGLIGLWRRKKESKLFPKRVKHQGVFSKVRVKLVLGIKNVESRK